MAAAIPELLFPLLLLLLGLWLEAGALPDPVSYTIQEELPPNTLIGNIPLNSRLDAKYNMSVLGKLRFRFLTSNEIIESGIFAVEERSGIISNTERVDRESLCPDTDECVLNFDVAVQPARYFEVVKVSMKITDLNDNSPAFPQSHIIHQIPESSLPGKSFSIPAAVDADSSQFSVQRYQLDPSDDLFQLKMRATPDGAVDLRLVLMQPLDRESVDYYEVKIIAYDGGRPPRSGSVMVDIHVLDANDNNPVFVNKSYEADILENVAVGTAILKVTASDIDVGLNGQIEYSFSQHSEENFGHIFGIDTETGEIYVRGEVDFEQEDMYLLSVVAVDRGLDSLPDHTNVIIRVMDVNDNAPAIKVTTLTKNGDSNVAENTPPGAFVAHVSVLDIDSGDNGEVTCTLDNDNFMLQKLYTSEYKIVTASTFDRERHPYFDLRLHCHDNGLKALSAYSSIRVNILDENDYAPEFTQQFYTASMRENNQVDDFILAVTAMDRDQRRNGWVKFRLHEDAGSLIKIDENSGWITANAVFDHEKMQELRFHVIASDKGVTPRSSTATILLSILDVDDEKPEFLEDRYAFSMSENQPYGTIVGQVIAADKDSEPYNYFTYVLDPHRSPVDVFDVDIYEGHIRTRRVLDREEQPVYYMVVIAKGEGRGKSSTASVSIYVADRNDNVPQFEFPTAMNHTIHISDQSPTGQVVARLKAHDYDTGDNARLAFLIPIGNEEDFFSFDSNTGVVSINRDLTKLEKKTFKLKVRVEDQGSPKLASETDLEIVVNNFLGYQRATGRMSISKNNLILLILFMLGTVIVSSIIIAVIIVIKRKDRQQEQTDNLKERERMLPTEDLGRPIQPPRQAASSGGNPAAPCQVPLVMNHVTSNATGPASSSSGGAKRPAPLPHHKQSSNAAAVPKHSERRLRAHAQSSAPPPTPSEGTPPTHHSRQVSHRSNL